MAYQNQQQQDSRNPNRLHLNFGFNNQLNVQAEQGRAFPTTPSTFPQPLSGGAHGQQEVWGAQQTTSGITNQGYFYNNPQPYQHLGPGAGSPYSPSPGTPGSYRSSPYDVTNGLAHQFGNQNLGGNSGRAGSPYNRQPSPGSRPRTGGGQQYGSYLGGPPPGPSIYDDEPPTKNLEKYSTVITERVKLQKMLTQEFFKENVERARARNERFVAADAGYYIPTIDVHPSRNRDLEATLQSKDLSDSRKEQRKSNMRKSEANFLRFLRTSERAENYHTLKIIGKGAFGEVKLVQRKHDGKVYALKSLIKSEMVCLELISTHTLIDTDLLLAQEGSARARPR